MSDTWGRNPHEAYTQQHHAWEQEQARLRAEEDRRYQEQLETVSNMFPKSADGGSASAWNNPRGAARGSAAAGGASGGGVASGIGDLLFHGGDWFVQHLWPLRLLHQAGLAIGKTPWYVRLGVMIIAAVTFAGLTVADEEAAAWPWAAALLQDIAGESAPLLALSIGAALGWLVIPLMALLLVLAVHLTGLAIFLALIAGVGWIIYFVVAGGAPATV